MHFFYHLENRWCSHAARHSGCCVQKHEMKLHALKQKKHQSFLNRPSAEASRPGHISVARQLLSAGACPDQGNRSALRVVHTLIKTLLQIFVCSRRGSVGYCALLFLVTSPGSMEQNRFRSCCHASMSCLHHLHLHSWGLGSGDRQTWSGRRLIAGNERHMLDCYCRLCWVMSGLVIVAEAAGEALAGTPRGCRGRISLDAQFSLSDSPVSEHILNKQIKKQISPYIHLGLNAGFAVSLPWSFLQYLFLEDLNHKTCHEPTLALMEDFKHSTGLES